MPSLGAIEISGDGMSAADAAHQSRQRPHREGALRRRARRTQRGELQRLPQRRRHPGALSHRRAARRRAGARARRQDDALQRPAAARALHEAELTLRVDARPESGPREPLRVMISCGEPSGDLYAGALAAEILQLEPDAVDHRFRQRAAARRRRVAGRATSRDCRSPDSPKRCASSRDRGRTTARSCAPPRRSRRDVFVPIDFPDFNFFLARALHKRGMPVVYYISPQLWAWRRGRLKTMKRVADRVLVIFPFEAPFYEQAGVPVTFVGHPLLELTAADVPREHVPARARARSGAAGRRAAAGQPAQRAARHPAGSGARGRRLIARARCPSAQFVIARAPHLDDELLAPLDRLAGRRVAAGRDRRADRRRPGERRRRRRRVGHRDGAGGAARLSDGRRLSRRAAHLQARQAAAARRHVCDGEPRRRARASSPS